MTGNPATMPHTAGNTTVSEPKGPSKSTRRRVETVRMDNQELVTAWLKSQEARGLSPKSTRRRERAIRSLAEYLQPVPLYRADPDMIEGWLCSFPNIRTKYHYRSDAKLFYEWAARRKLVPENPVEQVGKIRQPTCIPKPLSHAELGRLLHAMKTLPTRDRRIVGLALCAGLRAAEIAALEWSDVRLHDRVVVVRQGKRAKDRPVPLHPFLVEMLSPQETWGPVVPKLSGGHLAPETVSSRSWRLFHALGLEHVHIHRLRHTFGTEAARVSNGDLHAVAELMGHQNPSTTMGYVLLGANRGAQVIDAMFGPDGDRAA